MGKKIFHNRSTNSATVKVFRTPLLFYAIQIISPFRDSRISANHDKKEILSANDEILIKEIVYLL